MPGLVPTPTDRVDYYPEPHGARLISWSNVLSTSGAQTPLFLQDVSDWQTLIMRGGAAGAATNPGVWTVSWYADPQGTLLVGTDAVVVSPAMAVDVALAVKAPYVKVTTASITGAGTYPSGGSFLVSSLPPSTYQSVGQLLTQDSGTPTVPASSTRSYTAPVVTTGVARWNTQSQAAAGYTFQITATDPTNTARQLVMMDTATTHTHGEGSFYLPPWPLTVTMQNQEAANRSLWHSLTVGST